MELKRGVSREQYEQAFLLIVPYGIETWQNRDFGFVPETFNRTLWN